MGCKCGRDILYGENEIVKAESIRAHYNKKNISKKNTSNNQITNTNSLNNNDENLKIIHYNDNNGNNVNNVNIATNDNNENINKKNPEININSYYKKEFITNVNMNGTQQSSLDISQKKELTVEINDYPQKMIFLINKIRSDPLLYSQTIEDSIKYIKISKNNKIIYNQGVKVALHRGEEAFREAINQLKQTDPMSPLRYNPQLCIPLPENEEELNDKNFLKDTVDNMRGREANIEIYFKDLIKIPEVSVLLMIVDDNSKNTSKKRDTLLNKDFKYIGVNSKFIGKNFVAHFSFSR